MFEKSFKVLASPLTMGDLLSKPKPVEEVMKENKRAINKAIREVDREIRRMETQQKELTTNIKKMAKKGQVYANARLYGSMSALEYYSIFCVILRILNLLTYT